MENNLAEATVLVTSTPTVDLALVKLSTPTARPGELITYSLTVYNHGPADAAGVVVTDSLPEGVELISASPDCVWDGHLTVICSVALLPEDGEVTFDMTARVAEEVPLATSLENIAVVGSDALETYPSNNLDTADTSITKYYKFFLPIIASAPKPSPLADLTGRFVLEPDKKSFAAGEEVLIKVYVNNQGTAPAGPFWVDFYINPDPVPTLTNMLWQGSCSMDPCYGIAWQVAGLGPGESILLTSEPWSYDGMETRWDGSLPVGATNLYLRVNTYDPAGRDSPFGVTAEDAWYNNLYSEHGFTVGP
jgi:uncharacterized repeat protein (TIGR01451 family)